MKTFLASLTILLMICLQGKVLAGDLPQTKWVGDLPIMPELTVEPGLGFAFESPSGRIVMIYLSGAMSQETLKSYYDEALIPLGWKPVGSFSWARENERLKIEEVTTAGGKLWKIMLQPE
jgi:hypothetical protein